MGSNHWGHDAQLQWTRTPCIPWIQCCGTRSFAKQRKRKIVFSFLWRRQHHWIGSSHDRLRQTAQYLRSSSGHVRRAGLQNLWLFRTYRWTCCSGQSRDHGDSNRMSNKSRRTDDCVQGNLLQHYEQKIANLPEHLNVGITKTVAKRQYFTTLDDAELDKLGSSREYTLHRDNAATKVKGWIRGNTKTFQLWRWQSVIIKARYGIEIMIESLFGDGTCSWVVIVNGINKYVTEMTEETQKNHIDDIGDSTMKPVAKTKPKQTSISTNSSQTVTLPCHQGEWIDVEPGPYDKSCFEVSKNDQVASTRSWHRCFVQNLLSIGQFEHGWITCNKDEDLRRDSIVVWIHTLLIPY